MNEFQPSIFVTDEDEIRLLSFAMSPVWEIEQLPRCSISIGSFAVRFLSLASRSVFAVHSTKKQAVHGVKYQPLTSLVSHGRREDGNHPQTMGHAEVLRSLKRAA